MFDFKSFEPLVGRYITLSRLEKKDVSEVAQALFSPTTWVVAKRGVTSPDKLHSYLENFVNSDALGEGLTVVARVNKTNEVAGLSRYHSPGPRFLRIEIGYTWIADQWQRTFVNTEKKSLMLSYAFDTMKVKRVEFSVDPTNEKSNKAMQRLGAKYEGTLRKWRFLSEADKGDRNIYSIIEDEWPNVRRDLELRIKNS